jgi:hypothetical protein
MTPCGFVCKYKSFGASFCSHFPHCLRNEDRGSRPHRNVGTNIQIHTTSHPNRLQSSLPTAKFVLLLATKLVTADTFPPYVLVFHMQSHSDDDEHTHTVTKAKDSSSLNRQDRHQIPFPHRKSASSTVTIKAVHLPTKLHRVTSHTTFAHTAVRT